MDRIVAGDVSGDGYVDLVSTKPDGTLWYYRNNITIDSKPYSNGTPIGTNWTIYNRIF